MSEAKRKRKASEVTNKEELEPQSKVQKENKEEIPINRTHIVKKGKIRVTANGYVLFRKGVFGMFYQCKFTSEDGLTKYNSVIQYAQASKARMFGDNKSLHKIMNAESPYDAWKFGRKIKGFKALLWDTLKEKVVTTANYLKFSQNLELRDLLLEYSGVSLSSDNSDLKQLRSFVLCGRKEKMWGIAVDVHDINADHESTWRSDNKLGKAINKARDKIVLETEE